MLVAVFDTESNGLLKESKKSPAATKLWCIANRSFMTTNETWGSGMLYGPEQLDQGLAYLHTVDVLVGHGIKKHDLPLMKKLNDWEPKSHQVIVDTLIFSRTLNPRRPLPAGYTGNKTHSIEAWGHRLGLHKPEHEDWMNWSEDMGVRCIADAKINLLILRELEREAGDLSDYYEQLRTG